jgi:hypothetical protein
MFFPGSNITFYVLYSYVTDLLTLPVGNIVSSFPRGSSPLCGTSEQIYFNISYTYGYIIKSFAEAV